MPEFALSANVSYPGIPSSEVLDCVYTVGWTTSPARVVLTIAGTSPDGRPKDLGEIQGNGDLTLSDGLNPPVIIRDCLVVDLQAPNGDGSVYILTLLDGRWRWDFGEVSQQWNIPLRRTQTVPALTVSGTPPTAPTLPAQSPPRGEEPIDPDTRKTAPELAKLLLDAMKVKRYDVRGLDPQATPYVNWDCINPASALQQLASDLGCVVAFNPTNLDVLIARQGVGNGLPPGELQVSPQLAAKPRPNLIRLRGAPDRLQAKWKLRAAGMDFDGSVKPIEYLSYRPLSGDWTKVHVPFFDGLAPTASLPTGYTNLDAKTLASRSVYLYYLPCFFDDPENGKYPNPVWDALKKILEPKPPAKTTAFGIKHDRIRRFQQTRPPGGTIEWATPRLLSVQCRVAADDLGRQAQAPAKCYGKHSPPTAVKIGQSYLSQYDQTDVETEVRVPFDIVDVNTDQQAVKFHHYIRSTPSDDAKTYPAELVIEAAVEFRYKSYQYFRSGFELKLPNGPQTSGAVVRPGGVVLKLSSPPLPAVIVRDDVRVDWVATYDTGDTANDFLRLDNNKHEMKPRADYYLQGESRTYDLTYAGSATYPGFKPIFPDGAIQQVTWSMSAMTTTASMNTEHARYLPSFEERRVNETVNLEALRRQKQANVNVLRLQRAAQASSGTVIL